MRWQGIEVELELGSARAELDDVAGGEGGGADDALLVDVGAVAAVQVDDREPVLVGRILQDPGVLAPHEIVAFGVEPYVRRQVAPDEQIAGLVEGDRFDLLPLGAAQMS